MADDEMTETKAGRGVAPEHGPDRSRAIAEIERLKAERDTLALELQSLRHEVASERGPDRGTAIHFKKAGEPYCRPGQIVSEGFTERVSTIPGNPNAGFNLHCHLSYGEHESVQHEDRKGELYTPKHSWQVDRAWNPLGAPDTWHLADECPFAGPQPQSP